MHEITDFAQLHHDVVFGKSGGRIICALDECHDRLIDVINASPVDIVNFGDNVHSGTLPPELFIRHVLPALRLL